MMDRIPHHSGTGEEGIGCIQCQGEWCIPYTSELRDGTLEVALMLCPTCKWKTLERHALEPILIHSFTDPNKYYEVTPETGECDCPAKAHHPSKTCKHEILAEAVRELRRRRTGSTEADEETLTAYARRIFARVETKEAPEDAYRLFLEVRGYRYKTGALVEAGRRRHLKVMAMCESKAA